MQIRSTRCRNPILAAFERLVSLSGQLHDLFLVLVGNEEVVELALVAERDIEHPAVAVRVVVHEFGIVEEGFSLTATTLPLTGE